MREMMHARVPRDPRRPGLFAGGHMAVTTTILLAATSLGVLQRVHVRNIIGRSGIYALHLRPAGAVINKLGSRGRGGAYSRELLLGSRFSARGFRSRVTMAKERRKPSARSAAIIYTRVSIYIHIYII